MRNRMQASRHCVIHVLPVPSGAPGPSAVAAHAEFARFGLSGEVFSAEHRGLMRLHTMALRCTQEQNELLSIGD
jgi:hypothetical protein